MGSTADGKKAAGKGVAKRPGPKAKPAAKAEPDLAALADTSGWKVHTKTVQAGSRVGAAAGAVFAKRHHVSAVAGGLLGGMVGGLGAAVADSVFGRKGKK